MLLSAILTVQFSWGEDAPVDPASPTSELEKLKQLDFDELVQVRVATVTTASKRAEKATTAPGTVIVVTQREIQLRGYRNLIDVLKDLPGFEVSDHFFTELGAQVSIRGIPSNNKIVVLVNDMRVNPPGGEYVPFRSDFSIRTAKQIEITYGPGSTLYGQDAISAVINVKTADAPEPGESDVQGGAEGGFHSELDAWFSFGKSFDTAKPISVTGYFQYHDSDLSRLDRKYPRWYQDFRDIAGPKGAGSVFDRNDYGINAFAKLEVGNFSLQTWFRESERSSSEGLGSTILFYVPEAIWRDHSWVTEARHDWEITDKITLTSSGIFNWYEVDPVSRYVFPQDEENFFLDDYKYADGTSFSIEESLRVDFTEDFTALFGGIYTSYDILPKSTIPGGARPGSHADILKQGGNFVYYTVPGDPSSRQEISRAVESEYERYGGYAEFGWQASPKLRFQVGARVDKDSRINDPSFTPRGAVIYQVTDELTAKYTYSEAYISPAPYFAFSTYDRGDILNTSNPDVQPETSKSHELSFNYNKEKLDLGLSLYYGEQSNLILISDVGSTPNVVNPLVFVDLEGTMPRVLTQTVNSGNSHNAGLDFYGKAHLNDHVSSWFSYSYTDYEQETAGFISGLQGISAHNFRLGLTWEICDNLYLTPSLVARSTPQNIDAGSLGSELKNPWEMNLHLLYTPTDNFEVYAGIRNVTNNHNALTGFLPFAVPQETFGGVAGFRFRF